MNRNALTVAIAVASASAGLAGGALLFGRRAHAPSSVPQQQGKILYYRDPMAPARTSPVPKKDEMGMDYVPVYEGEGPPAGTGERGVYVDPRMTQNTGVREEEVRVRRLTKVIRTVGHVTYDERRLHILNAKVGGWIEKLYVDYTGKPVRRGDPLMAIYSPELVSTQEEYLLALRHRDAIGGSTQAAVLDDAMALVAAARRRLRNFDVPEGEVRELERRGSAVKTLTLRSPADGYVVEKSVAQGAQITPGAPLFKIADLSNVWVLADVYEYELPWVRVGQDATVELPYVPGAAMRGRVTYVYPYLAGETRTVRVRIEVRHPDVRVQLKPDMYATVTIESPVVREAVAISEQAVIRTGERSVGIVSLGNGWFEPRDLRLGVTADGWVEVLQGVRAGERIVTSSQFLIDSESNLRSAVSSMAAPRAEEAGASRSARSPPASRHGDRGAKGSGAESSGHEHEPR